MRASAYSLSESRPVTDLIVEQTKIDTSRRHGEGDPEFLKDSAAAIMCSRADSIDPRGISHIARLLRGRTFLVVVAHRPCNIQRLPRVVLALFETHLVCRTDSPSTEASSTGRNDRQSAAIPPATPSYLPTALSRAAVVPSEAAWRSPESLAIAA